MCGCVICFCDRSDAGFGSHIYKSPLLGLVLNHFALLPSQSVECYPCICDWIPHEVSFTQLLKLKFLGIFLMKSFSSTWWKNYLFVQSVSRVQDIRISIGVILICDHPGLIVSLNFSIQLVAAEALFILSAHYGTFPFFQKNRMCV